MVDVVLQQSGVQGVRQVVRRMRLRNVLRRKSTVAFFMTLPLILLIAILVIRFILRP
jgi:multiple sugar transport system permease protein